jgi:hypothetical protein
MRPVLIPRSEQSEITMTAAELSTGSSTTPES